MSDTTDAEFQPLYRKWAASRFGIEEESIASVEFSTWDGAWSDVTFEDPKLVVTIRSPQGAKGEHYLTMDGPLIAELLRFAPASPDTPETEE
jgi:hypothetical protein